MAVASIHLASAMLHVKCNYILAYVILTAQECSWVKWVEFVTGSTLLIWNIFYTIYQAKTATAVISVLHIWLGWWLLISVSFSTQWIGRPLWHIIWQLVAMLPVQILLEVRQRMHTSATADHIAVFSGTVWFPMLISAVISQCAFLAFLQCMPCKCVLLWCFCPCQKSKSNEMLLVLRSLLLSKIL